MSAEPDELMEDAPALEAAPPVPIVPPLLAYIEALKNYDGAILVEIARGVGIIEPPSGRVNLASTIAERYTQTRVAEARLAGLPRDGRLALALFALTETASWPVHSLSHAIKCLGADPIIAVLALLQSGLVAGVAPENLLVRDLEKQFLTAWTAPAWLRAHPSALASARTVLPEGPELPKAISVRQVRECDGLEPILRMAALWQRVADLPLRQTQQGTIYKRDRERIEDDPVLAGPIADALEPLPDMPALWLSLARGVGLIEAEADTERVVAARPEFWSDNSFHLAQMVAVRWLSLTNWHEQGGLQRDGAVHELALPYTRTPILLWLATLEQDAWVATADLADFLHERAPEWDIPSFAARGESSQTMSSRGPRKPRAPRIPVDPSGVSTLEAMLLGPAYQLGLVRAAEEDPSGRRAVQLTPLGRYLLALGPPPAPRPAFDQFLFVQPSFEIIAYRQGLTPGLIGQFSRFTHWTQLGAALALKLTPESVYRGLEGGMSPKAMLDLLGRHSSRPLSSSVAESLKTWAGRRERVTYHASATLIEFANDSDLEQALSGWPADHLPLPVRVSDRLLLVERDAEIPFPRFRMAGSRDYRRPPDSCVEVEADGVSLNLNMARSDLLVDAEIARFADESTASTGVRSAAGAQRRRYSVTSASLARGLDAGVTPANLDQWFRRRAGQETPPSIRLMVAAQASRIEPLVASRPLVLSTLSADVLDGLAQHPETRALLGDRLGPTTVVIPESALPAFRDALGRLGLNLLGPSANGAKAHDPRPPRSPLPREPEN